LISLHALNGLRVSEALGADIEDLGLERGTARSRSRTGGKVVTVPLTRERLAIDLVVSERCDGRSSSDRSPRRRADRAPHRPPGGSPSAGPHLRHAFITAALTGVPLRDVQEAASHADPRTTMRYDRARVSLDRHATYIVATFLAGASR
jgi:integrase